MEPQKIDAIKLCDMVMCGDHPSFTKTELNAKEALGEKEKRKQKDPDERRSPTFYGRLTPTQSRAGVGAAPGSGASVGGGAEARERPGAGRARAASEHTLPAAPRAALPTTRAHAQLLQAAALGSFRWPPYLLCVWVLVLVLGHVLHCVVGVLERTLPALRKSCQYFRTWTEASWKAEGGRAAPVALAAATGALYALYAAVFVAYSVTLWAVEPLCDVDDKASVDELPKITDYIDEVNSRLDTALKQ